MPKYFDLTQLVRPSLRRLLIYVPLTREKKVEAEFIFVLHGIKLMCGDLNSQLRTYGAQNINMCSHMTLRIQHALANTLPSRRGALVKVVSYSMRRKYVEQRKTRLVFM
jgi:hypothetical protein